MFCETYRSTAVKRNSFCFQIVNAVCYTGCTKVDIVGLLQDLYQSEVWGVMSEVATRPNSHRQSCSLACLDRS